MIKIKIAKTLLLFAIPFFIFILLDFLYPLNQNMLQKEESKILYDTNNQIISMKISDDEIWRFKVSLDEIPQHIINATLHFEDKYFYYHFGINPFAIIRSFFANLTGKKRLGASTITMQVARMINPKKRTYFNKIIEIFNALQLEFHYTKDEILEFYYNLAPYGGNLEGIKSASYFYFNSNLDKLTLSQAAILSIIPKNPNKNRLDKISNANSIKNSLLKRLFKAKTITQDELKRAMSENFKPKRIKALQNAEHYSLQAFKNSLTKTNLNLKYQIAITKLLNDKLEQIKYKNVKNASALIIDNKKMQVVAYVGSSDTKAKNGQINGVTYKKPVGSTLKPFIYALALENGLITPKMKLIDTEIYIKSYAPQNYFEEFAGIISSKNALAFSLNTTAVRLNELLGENSLYELLKNANLINKNKDYYGSSIALGSASLSLLELAHLYTILANEGTFKPLEYAGNIVGTNKNLLTKQSVYLINQILLDAPRIHLNNVWKNANHKPEIAFKTGTSANSRDLYTIGVNPNFTIAVWFGNFNYEKTDNLSGSKAAQSVVFDMFEYLDKEIKFDKFNKPNGIVESEICTDAFNFNECKSLEFDEKISGVDIVNRCEILRSEDIIFGIKSGYIDKNDILKSPCFEKTKNLKPLIATPFENEIILVDKGTKSAKIMVKCMAFFGEFVYVKTDKEYQKYENSKGNFIDFGIGKQKINCLDENGNFSTIDFEIKEI